MFCDACGKGIPDTAAYCPECGYRLEGVENAPAVAPAPASPVGSVGFADLRQYPELVRHLKGSRKLGTVVALLMTAAPFAGFVLYSALTGEMELKEAMGVGAGVSFVFMLFSVSFALKERSRQGSWTGTVTDKRTELRKERETGYDETRTVKVKHLVMTVRREDGGASVTKDFGGNEALFNYYEVGDRVRHIGGTFALEKYDKRPGDEVVCVMCGGLYDKREDDRCQLCRLPLLK